MVSVPSHVNNTLPPVDLFIYVKVEGEFKRVKRKTWASSNNPNHIEVFDEEDNSYLVKMEKVQWFYP
ncbi:hypothetical protein ROCKET24_152 [Vibrio phage Rocket24]|uniref:Uncharacterized protein n=1 Tax=Vibrio phage Chester TaxID=2712961 RepID=A0A6G8R586_9CAUD|nr:hypothetical protein KNU88_gp154 [Vibrio phage Chester]QIG66253.1 hypothetical protein CILSICK_154 [Vibrio phage Cilsick]QIN96559.1 hypothetical protein CHESTER_156 [Vibrio phage Chester]WBU77135.1 hypothetical protein NOELLE_151 [Vibrio phage Noelle]WCD55825.1 hypothetical protein ROCKET24_152 [Vibrio phage Rocket24]